MIIYGIHYTIEQATNLRIPKRKKNICFAYTWSLIKKLAFGYSTAMVLS